MVTVAWASPYARAEGGLAASFLTHLSWHHVAGSTGILAAALGWVFGLLGTLVILLVGSMLVLAAWAGCRSWFGGITGDTLGAINEVVEILFLLLIPSLLLLP